MLEKLKEKLKNHINCSLSEKIEWFIIITLIILPILTGIIYIYSFGVNVPYWDQWDYVSLYIGHVFDNKLSIFDLVAQQNESRPFFPRILMIILAFATDYNTVSEMFLLYILYFISFLVVFLMYKRDHGIDRNSLIKFIPISWFFFNLFQMGNMLFGARIVHALEILTFLSTVYIIDSSKTFDKKFFGAILSAIISTFSFISGLLTWPIGLIQIILNGSKGKIRKIFIWIICSSLVFVTYFYHYIKPSGHPPLLYSFYNPLDAITVFLSSIGSTIVRDLLLSKIIGALILIITCSIILLNKKDLNLDRNAKWLSLVMYSFLVSIEITIGRAGFGTSYVVTSDSERYLLLTFFSIIGLYCISINTLKNCQNSSSTDKTYKKECNYTILGIILCLFILGTSAFFITGIENGEKTKQFREEIAYYLKTYKIQPDKNLQKLLPAPDIVRYEASLLEKYKLSIFSDKNIDINILTRSYDDTLNYIDTINNKIVRPEEPVIINKEKDNEIMISGWAVDMYTNMPANSVFITIDNKTDIPTRYFIDRKDVADTFKNDNFRYSGFMASFASAIIENGNHSLTIKIVSKDMTRYYESKQRFDIIVI